MGRVLAERKDKELRPGAWHDVHVRVHASSGDSGSSGGGTSVTVRTTGGASVFDVPSMMPADEVASAEPFVGVGVFKGSVQWRGWEVTAAQGGGSGGGERKVAPYSGDDPHLVEALERDILDRELGVTFDDIASLEDAKALLNEAVVLPLIIPEAFTGIREPWKGVLLYGPPGTGKTLLARAVAGTAGLTFFNCSAATLTSKWRGESEKMVRALFGLARHHAPSVIFIDEVDALASTRGADGEHESSRRFKAELLAQMDGIASTNAQAGGAVGGGGANANVMVLATTNAPWDLDEALRRRLEKRIHVPLPDAPAREQALRIHLRDVNLGEGVDLGRVARDCEGFSGADLKVVCRDAAMRPMRRLASGKTPEQLRAMRDGGALSLDAALTADDFAQALGRTRPSVAAADTARFAEWAKEYGST